jgi:hypothetical protein
MPTSSAAATAGEVWAPPRHEGRGCPSPRLEGPRRRLGRAASTASARPAAEAFSTVEPRRAATYSAGTMDASRIAGLHSPQWLNAADRRPGASQRHRYGSAPGFSSSRRVAVSDDDWVRCRATADAAHSPGTRAPRTTAATTASRGAPRACLSSRPAWRPTGPAGGDTRRTDARPPC